MTPALDESGPDGEGCGCREGGGQSRGRDRDHGGGCCGGRRHDEEATLSRDEEIALLERRIADSRARLDELRRG